MGSLIGRMQGLTVLQESALDAQNADTNVLIPSLNLTGAIRGILFVDWAEPDISLDDGEDAYSPTTTYTAAAATGSTPGVLSFEVSTDEGVNWAAAAVVRLIDYDDSQVAMSSLGPDLIPGVFKIDHLDGFSLFRARISSNFAAGIVVRGVAIGR